MLKVATVLAIVGALMSFVHNEAPAAFILGSVATLITLFAFKEEKSENPKWLPIANLVISAFAIAGAIFWGTWGIVC